MAEIDFSHPQLNNIIKKELSIQVSLNGFSFLIRSVSDNTMLAFKHHEFSHLHLVDELLRKVEHILASDKKLQSEFEKSTITYINQNATLVPDEFFNVDELKTIFEFNHNLNELDELHHNHIEEIKAHNVFSLPNYLTNIFYNKYKNIEFRHQASNLIKFGSSVIFDKYTILIGINSTFFDLVVFENKHLLLYNSFQYTNALDFIYFLLYAFNQLKIEPSTQNVYILGEASKNKALIQELKRNVRKVINAKIPADIPSRLGSKLNTESFYNLFTK